MLGGRYAKPPFVANALTVAAVELADARELTQLAQGAGFVELTRAFELMERGRVWHGARLDTDNRAQRRLSLDRRSASGPTLPPDTFGSLLRAHLGDVVDGGRAG